MRTIRTINKTNEKYLGYQNSPYIYGKCPDCNGDIVYGMISCPDERPRCLVAHHNFACKNCKSVFNISFEKDKDDLSKKIFIIEEVIGEAIINPRGIKKLL